MESVIKMANNFNTLVKKLQLFFQIMLIVLWVFNLPLCFKQTQLVVTSIIKSAFRIYQLLEAGMVL